MAGTPASSISTGGAGAVTQVFDSLLTGSQATFDITSISGGYTSLQLLATLRSDRGVSLDSCLLRFNNDSGANYARQTLSANGAAVTASQANGQTSVDCGAATSAADTATYPGTFVFFIPSYAGTTFVKVFQCSNDYAVGSGAGARTHNTVNGVWSSTAAITRITLIPALGSNWVAGSRCTLYGIT